MSEAPWWRGAVLYQVYPRSFQDSNGDGVGDLPGLLARLDHIAGLGVDGVWLSPVFRSPMADFGYDVEDHCEVDPVFGTGDDLDRVIATAHRLGLKVLLDLALSHTSDRHRWFCASRATRTGPFADWYVWADPRPDGTPPNNWLSLFGGSAWTWAPERQQYYLHNFLARQPDLNFHSPGVVEAQLEVVRHWLARGVDGFRLDVVNFYAHDPALRDNPVRRDPTPLDAVLPASPYGFQNHRFDKSRPETLSVLGRLRSLVDTQPGRFLLGEVHDDDMLARMAEYCAGGDRLHSAYAFALLGPEGGAGHLRAVIEGFERQPGGGWPTWSLSNHDVVRVVSRWGAGAPRTAFAKLMIALLGSLRGTVVLYQGEELGLPQAILDDADLHDPVAHAFWPVDRGRDGCRTPMAWTDHAHGDFTTATPWLPVPDDHLALAVARQAGDPESVLAFTRGFLAWRRRRPALCRGRIDCVDVAPPLLGLRRTLGPDTLVALFNLGPAPATADLDALGVPGAGAFDWVAPPDDRPLGTGARLALDPWRMAFGAPPRRT